MLNIYLGEMKEAIYHPPTYFDNRYEDEWITDPLSVKMIKDVDKSDVVSELCKMDSGNWKTKRTDSQSAPYYGFWR